MSLLLLLAAVAAPPSERPTGTNIPGGKTSSPVHQMGNIDNWKSADLVSQAQARRTIRIFAQCAVKSHRAAAAKAVLDDLPNRSIIERYSSLLDEWCVSKAEKTGFVRLGFPGDTFRYALAEALVNAEVQQPLADLTGVAPRKHRTHNPEDFQPRYDRTYTKSGLKALEEGRALDQTEIFVDEFGECVVRADPLNSHKLLFAEPVSREEDAIISALTPKMGGCLKKGQKLAIDVSMVRGTIAVNYYRLAKAPSVAPAEVPRQ